MCFPMLMQAKAKKQWTTPRRDASDRVSRDIEPGDSGIWVTCEMGKEARCVTELRALFEEHADELYGQSKNEDLTKLDSVEDAITKELDELRNKDSKLFISVRLNDRCLLFFKTVPPVDPASFVLSYCQSQVSNPGRKRAHAVQRLTPITLFTKATEKGVDELAEKVLEPHFHADGVKERKFAIRTNIRAHKVLTRDILIKQVASKVGPKHKVDLKNYELLILVEVFKVSCERVMFLTYWALHEQDKDC